MRQYRDPDALSLALAEPSRRAILESLRLEKKSVGELVAVTALKQPNVSNHLARMREQGIVRAERLGRHVYYSIALPVAELLLRLHETTADTLIPLGHSPRFLREGAESLLPKEAIGLPFDPLSAPEPRLEAWRDTFYRTILAGREDRAHMLVNDLLTHRIDLETIYLGVFEWSMHRIGELYVQGETDVAHEHMASAIVERMMGRVALFYTPLAHKPYRALLGGIAGNWHVLGLRMLCDGLRTQGWETLYLGANVPTAGFLTMATTEPLDLIVVSCMLEESMEELKLLLTQLDAARREFGGRHYRLAAGGQFLKDHPEALRDLPIDFGGGTLHDFLVTVAHLYPGVNAEKKY